jgi:hypothetical protein
MRLWRVFTLAVLVPVLASSQGANQLEGCLNPGVVASALETIHATDWRNVSLERLRSIWPTELDALDCDTEVCHSVWSKDRIIKGHCQCCATFYFDVKRNSDGSSRREELQNIIINYTGLHRKELIADARRFARASGVPESDLATVGNDRVQNFNWESASGNEKDIYGVEVRFTRQGASWELYFNVGRNAMVPHSSDSQSKRN